MEHELFAGTSGYSYKEWKGAFYPEDLAATRFLSYYSEKLSTVEINNTFYRFPSEKMLEGWTTQTPEHFRFAVKANAGITHRGRLKDVESLTTDFVTRCQLLGEKLGPILFQLPPSFRRDDARLETFLATLPEGTRYAMEFRHESWFDDAVFQCLTDSNVALCVSEGDKLDSPRVTTADHAYARLRRAEYTQEELRTWHSWIHDQLGTGRDVYAYLKHDDAGVSPERALQLLA